MKGRYEKSSTIITPNRDLDEWYSLFGDKLLASAAMDRLLHRASPAPQVGFRRCDSFRNPPVKKLKK
ncbi:MAG: ATP-binding protein [Deltaproteobacteria bacterium]|nr:ATP-binding protein [Deltaproteobacteria bacterium]